MSWTLGIPTVVSNHIHSRIFRILKVQLALFNILPLLVLFMFGFDRVRILHVTGQNPQRLSRPRYILRIWKLRRLVNTTLAKYTHYESIFSVTFSRLHKVSIRQFGYSPAFQLAVIL